MKRLPSIVQPDYSNITPARLKVIAETAEGRQVLQQQRAKLQELRDECAEKARKQLAITDEMIARIDVALKGREMAV